MSELPEWGTPEPISVKTETPFDAVNKANAAIDRQGARILAYYISSQIGNLAGKIVPLDAFETHKGISEEHGEFEIGMVRVYSTNRSLLRDWVILPDGNIWTCGVNEQNPDLLELDTLERPTDKELIKDRTMLMDAVAAKAGVFINPKTGEYRPKEVQG